MLKIVNEKLRYDLNDEVVLHDDTDNTHYNGKIAMLIYPQNPYARLAEHMYRDVAVAAGCDFIAWFFREDSILVCAGGMFV